MACLGPVTRMKNATRDKMYLSTINKLGSIEGREREIRAGRWLDLPYRKGMGRVEGAEVRFRVRAEGRALGKEIFPYTVSICSDIDIVYKLGDGSVVQEYVDGAVLDFRYDTDTDGQCCRIGLVRWFRGLYDSCPASGICCFAAGQEANVDVQGQDQVVLVDHEALDPPIPHVIIAHSTQSILVAETPIPRPDEIQPIINGQTEVEPVVETPNPPISQPNIQPTINGALATKATISVNLQTHQHP